MVCPYPQEVFIEILAHEFTQCFRTNDKRTVERYIGRPEVTIESGGFTGVIRVNPATGNTANFRYYNKTKLTRKIGLMENMGYITLQPEGQTIIQEAVRSTQKRSGWVAVVHHERMDYSSKQSTLEDRLEPRKEGDFHSDSVAQSEEGIDDSKENACV